jgi:hypothetical protein
MGLARYNLIVIMQTIAQQKDRMVVLSKRT